jgi:hypothetical protein
MGMGVYVVALCWYGMKEDAICSQQWQQRCLRAVMQLQKQLAPGGNRLLVMLVCCVC